MMLKKILGSMLLVLSILLISGCGKKEEASKEEGLQKTVNVKTIKIGDSKVSSHRIEYPGLVVSDKETNMVARVQGNVVGDYLKIGSRVSAGQVIFRIADLSSGQLSSGSGVRSAEIVQAEMNVERAKESLDLAKKNYSDVKNKKDEDNREEKTQRDLAEIQYRQAVEALNALMDNYVIKAPISGIISKKEVVSGDAVAVGQSLATITGEGQSKIHFYVSKDELGNFSEGMRVGLKVGGTETEAALINGISTVADDQTRKFLVEVVPENKAAQLDKGTIVSVAVDLKEEASSGRYIIPISSMTIGQNNSFVFFEKDGISKKADIEVVRIVGEKAEVHIEGIGDEELLIVEGNKQLRDGDLINSGK